MVELSGGQETVSENPGERSIKRWEDGSYSIYDLGCFLIKRKLRKSKEKPRWGKCFYKTR